MAEQPQDAGTELPFGERMADLLAELARGLVDDPDAIDVEVDEEGGSTVLRLFVAPDDLEKVTGKQGRTARALRTVLSAIAGKSQQRISLEVLEDDEDEDEDGSDSQ